jgi:hypothetical protein
MPVGAEHRGAHAALESSPDRPPKHAGLRLAVHLRFAGTPYGVEVPRFLVQHIDSTTAPSSGRAAASCETMYEAKVRADVLWRSNVSGTRQSIIDRLTNQRWSRVDGNPEWSFASDR